MTRLVLSELLNEPDVGALLLDLHFKKRDRVGHALDEQGAGEQPVEHRLGQRLQLFEAHGRLEVLERRLLQAVLLAELLVDLDGRVLWFVILMVLPMPEHE